MYSTGQQFRELVHIASLILEGDYEGAKRAAKPEYILEIPNRVKREINKLPEVDKLSLGRLLDRAKTELNSMTQPHIKNFREDVWYFRTKSARAYYVKNTGNKKIHILLVYKKQSNKMPSRIAETVMSRRKEIKI